MDHFRGKAICAFRSEGLLVDVLGEDLQCKNVEVMYFKMGISAVTKFSDLFSTDFSYLVICLNFKLVSFRLKEAFCVHASDLELIISTVRICIIHALPITFIPADF